MKPEEMSVCFWCGREVAPEYEEQIMIMEDGDPVHTVCYREWIEHRESSVLADFNFEAINLNKECENVG